jgi:GxxExxY protein
MMIELKKIGIPVNTQAGIKVFYEGTLINESDGYMLIDNKVIIKIKTAGCLEKEDETELFDYLKAANIDVGFLLNFGTKPEFTLTMNNNFQGP